MTAPTATATRVDVVLGATPARPGVPRQLPDSGSGGMGATRPLTTLALALAALGAGWGGIYLMTRRRSR